MNIDHAKYLDYIIVKDVFKKYQKRFDIKLKDVIEKYNQHHRHYHNIFHVYQIIDYIKESEIKIPSAHYDGVILAALFHDVIYNPRRDDNEIKSIEFFKDVYTKVKNDKIYDIVISCIEATNINGIQKPGTPSFFRLADYNILSNKSLLNLIQYENKIAKEYQFCSRRSYVDSRCEFLMETMPQFNNTKVVIELCKYIRGKQLKVGFYPGSFDPFHIGHQIIAEKADAIFDKIIIGVGSNPDKQTTSKTRADLIKLATNFEVIEYTNLTASEIKRLLDEYPNITLIRGIRNGNDFEYETNLINAIKDYLPEYDLPVIYIPCDKNYSHVSSSVIRSIEKTNEDNIYKPKFM